MFLPCALALHFFLPAEDLDEGSDDDFSDEDLNNEQMGLDEDEEDPDEEEEDDEEVCIQMHIAGNLNRLLAQ